MTKNKPITTAKRIQRSAAHFIELLKVRRDDEITSPHIKWSDSYVMLMDSLECTLNTVISATAEEIGNIYDQRQY